MAFKQAALLIEVSLKLLTHCQVKGNQNRDYSIIECSLLSLELGYLT